MSKSNFKRATILAIATLGTGYYFYSRFLATTKLGAAVAAGATTVASSSFLPILVALSLITIASVTLTSLYSWFKEPEPKPSRKRMTLPTVPEIPEIVWHHNRAVPLIDPVVTHNGDTYERAAIENWIDNQQYHKNLKIDNRIKQALKESLVPNILLKSVIGILDRLEYEFAERNEFICPIGATTMQNPMLTKAGFTYGCEGIKQWLEDTTNNKKGTDPMDPNKVLIDNDGKYTLTPNKAVKAIIDYYHH